jgi:rifampin ADP-ribosylating transferase
LLELLPESVHAIAIDQRGHGDSECPDVGYSLDSMAEDVEGFMDAWGISTAVLVGSSSGGYMAQHVAVRNPNRVTGLVLAGSPRTLQGRAPFADEVDRLTDPIDPDWVRRSLTWFPRFHHVPAWYIDDRVRDGARVPPGYGATPCTVSLLRSLRPTPARSRHQPSSYGVTVTGC